MARFEKITKDNVSEFIAVISSNSNKANFAYWTDMVNLKKSFAGGNDTLNTAWKATQDTVAEVIDDANYASPHKRLNPSIWGYILAAKDCDQFALYRDFVLKKLLEVQSPHKMKGLSQGEKYQFLNDLAYYLGELMQAEKGDKGEYQYTALNGQDFLWMTLGDDY